MVVLIMVRTLSKGGLLARSLVARMTGDNGYEETLVRMMTTRTMVVMVRRMLVVVVRLVLATIADASSGTMKKRRVS